MIAEAYNQAVNTVEEPQNSAEQCKSTLRTRGLIPWKKGQSGNPAGKAKGRKSIIALIEERLYKSKNDAEREAVVTAYIESMKAGSFQHLKEFIDRQDGKSGDKPVLNIEINNTTNTLNVDTDLDNLSKDFDEFARRALGAGTVSKDGPGKSISDRQANHQTAIQIPDVTRP